MQTFSSKNRLPSWRSELSSELDRNRNQTNLLLKTRSQLQHAMKETEGPLRVNSECLYTREGRMGIDRVSDVVEANLHTEVDQIKQSQGFMARQLEHVRESSLVRVTCAQVDQQISANRNARHQLALDLANKDSALQIDHSARNMHNNSRWGDKLVFKITSSSTSPFLENVSSMLLVFQFDPSGVSSLRVAQVDQPAPRDRAGGRELEHPQHLGQPQPQEHPGLAGWARQHRPHCPQRRAPAPSGWPRRWGTWSPPAPPPCSSSGTRPTRLSRSVGKKTTSETTFNTNLQFTLVLGLSIKSSQFH